MTSSAQVEAVARAISEERRREFAKLLGCSVDEVECRYDTYTEEGKATSHKEARAAIAAYQATSLAGSGGVWERSCRAMERNPECEGCKDGLPLYGEFSPQNINVYHQSNGVAVTHTQVRDSSPNITTAPVADALERAAKEDNMTKSILDVLVDRFLGWPMPQSVCSDPCVTDNSYKFPRHGTSLLNAGEARQMLEYVLIAIREPIEAAAKEEADRFFAKECALENANFKDGARFAINQLIGISPSPSSPSVRVPVEPTEEQLRERFEEWMASSNYPEIADIALEKLPDGNYKSQLTFAAWQAWKAPLRLALAASPSASRGGEARNLDPRDPDHSRRAPFNYHNCWRCNDGAKPCVNGNPRNCENLHARND